MYCLYTHENVDIFGWPLNDMCNCPEVKVPIRCDLLSRFSYRSRKPSESSGYQVQLESSSLSIVEGVANHG